MDELATDLINQDATQRTFNGQRPLCTRSAPNRSKEVLILFAMLDFLLPCPPEVRHSRLRRRRRERAGHDSWNRSKPGKVEEQPAPDSSTRACNVHMYRNSRDPDGQKHMREEKEKHWMRPAHMDFTESTANLCTSYTGTFLGWPHGGSALSPPPAESHVVGQRSVVERTRHDLTVSTAPEPKDLGTQDLARPSKIFPAGLDDAGSSLLLLYAHARDTLASGTIGLALFAPLVVSRSETRPPPQASRSERRGRKEAEADTDPDPDDENALESEKNAADAPGIENETTVPRDFTARFTIDKVKFQYSDIPAPAVTPIPLLSAPQIHCRTGTTTALAAAPQAPAHESRIHFDKQTPPQPAHPPSTPRGLAPQRPQPLLQGFQRDSTVSPKSPLRNIPSQDLSLLAAARFKSSSFPAPVGLAQSSSCQLLPASPSSFKLFAITPSPSNRPVTLHQNIDPRPSNLDQLSTTTPSCPSSISLRPHPCRQTGGIR
ncbi:hypothetical protein G7046_g8624 [Stylonectria norvegica]|nr:hypothetical protein G7046_g8624 [Stylonectria norvegica]